MSRKRRRISHSYYSSEKLDRYGPSVKYKCVIGKRSNGKTYQMKKKIIDRLAVDKSFQFAYIRRLKSHVSYQRLGKLFSDMKDYCMEVLGDTISYSVKNGFYLTHDKEKKTIGHKFSVEDSELERGISFHDVQFIFFDEFMSIDGYFTEEIDKFKSIISTIVRGRDTVEIWMVANTVNERCPYFDWFGISPKNLKKGHISYIEHRAGLKAVIEWCLDTDIIRDVESAYFGVDDNSSNMIINGDWETMNLTIKEIDGITWAFKDRRLIPIYITGMEYVFEISYANTKFPIAFVRRVNTQEGKVNTAIKFNLTLDETILKNADGYVPKFKKVSTMMGESLVNQMKMFDECIETGRVIFANAMDGTRFLNIYNEIMTR